MSKKAKEEAKMETQEQAVENAVAIKQDNMPTEADNAAAWGEMNISAQDIIIPRILLMQPMSEKVTAGEAKFGEFRESLNWEEIGSFDKPFEFIPFHLEKVFIEFNAENPEDKVYLRTVPITPANEHLPYEDEEFNQELNKRIKVSRDKSMNFYVLLPHELEMGTAIPHLIACRRTSIKAGKALAMQFYKNNQARLSPAAVTMQMVSKKQTEDKKTWAVMEVKPLKKTDSKYIAEAFKWMQMIVQGKAKAHTEAAEMEVNSEARAARSSGESVDDGPVRF